MPLLTAIRTGQMRSPGLTTPGLGTPAANAAAVKPASPAGATPFSNVLQTALKSVSESQNEVGQLQRDFQLGKPGVSIEQTMVAMQKSQIEFQAAVTVRNRLVSAYTDIMNMNV